MKRELGSVANGPSSDIRARWPTPGLLRPQLPSVTMAHVQDPPELLHWARDTLNGITALRGQARRREIDLSDEVHALLLQMTADLERIVDRNHESDPRKWAL
jgi:hypothetical protein